MKNLTIKYTTTIKEAMKALDSTAENCLLVIDDEQKLIGTLTDGDIRRYILLGCDLKGTIEKAFNSFPTFIFEDKFDLDNIKKTLTSKKLDLIPIINYEYKIVDYITWGKAFGNGALRPKPKLDNPVVIMAGGKGERMEPFTKVLPKPLIPINEKPIIEHIIDRFVEYGIRDFWLMVNYKSSILKAYFEERQPDYLVHFINEPRELGTAGSLKYLTGKIKKPFFVKNCDIIIKTDYNDLLEFHQKGDYSITLVASVKHYNIPYGICELNSKGYLDYIKEKPEYSFMVNTGLYILNPDILELIPWDEFFHITHLIERSRNKGKKVGVYPISEDSWIDVGQWTEYRKALEKMDI
jgi:dTDP-glucose pyrophosphorylase